MSATDYLINAALVAMVIRQVVGRRMTVSNLIFPLVVVGWAATNFLHGVPTAGNDLWLVAAGTAAGAALGIGCGLATGIHLDSTGAAVAKAGWLAAVLWVAGVGSRMAFAVVATNGGGQAIGRFSIAHHITSSEAWVAALVLMALAEVVGRVGVLAFRGWRSGGLVAGGAVGRLAGARGQQ